MTTAASRLAAAEDVVAERSAERFFARRPRLAERWGDAGKDRCREDARFHVRFLAAALAADEPAIFADYTAWAGALLERLGIGRGHLAEAYDDLAAAIDELAPDAAGAAAPVLEAGRRSL